MQKHIISALVQNHSGVLSKVSGLFGRRGFNIESLAVGICEKPGYSRMTIIVNGDEHVLDQVTKQLAKLIGVIEVESLDENETVPRELVLIKVNVELDSRSEIIQIAQIFRANIVDISEDTLTLELTGQESKIEGFINILKPYEIEKIMRTGIIAMPRG